MSVDLERQLHAFARALNARSRTVTERGVVPVPPRRRQARPAWAMGLVVVVLLVALPLVFFRRPETVSPTTSTVVAPSTTTPAETTTLTHPETSEWPPFVYLTPEGIDSPLGPIWRGEIKGPRKMVRDGWYGLVFTDSRGLWWLKGFTGDHAGSAPELVSEVTGELVEVVHTPSGPVARIDTCPSTYIDLRTGTTVPPVEGRVRVDCVTGVVTWGWPGELEVALTEPDGDGIVWMEVTDAGELVARLPVGGPYIAARIEDFQGLWVLLSRAGSDGRDALEELVWVAVPGGVIFAEAPWEVASISLAGPDSHDLGWEPDLYRQAMDEAGRFWAPNWTGERAYRRVWPEFLDALPEVFRTERKGEVREDDGSTYLITALDDRLRRLSDAWGCRIPGPDWCTLEHGEIQFRSGEDELLWVLPLPTIPPRWIATVGDYVYAGSVGDGALPDSALIRVHKETRKFTVVLFEADEPYEWQRPEEWVVIPWDDPRREVLDRLVRFEPFEGGTRVSSSIGDLYVDIEGVDAFIEEIAGGA